MQALNGDASHPGARMIDDARLRAVNELLDDSMHRARLLLGVGFRLLALGEDGTAEVHLVLGDGDDFLVDGSLGDEAVHRNLFLLSEAVTAILGLAVDLRVEVTVV